MKVTATDKPSWAVQVINEATEDTEQSIVAKLDLDKADRNCDRIDLVCTHNGEVIAVKGDVGQGVIALNPEIPKIPIGAKVIAQVWVRGASRYIDDMSITNYGAGVLQTGEMPALPAVLEDMNRSVFLDSEDAFDRLLIPMVRLQRAKRADYADEDNIFSNFDKNAAQMNLPGYTPLEDCLSMVIRKVGRITNLRDKEPQNETVMDSYLDLAVYAILAYGLALREAEQGT
jgi:hypothetical protein